MDSRIRVDAVRVGDRVSLTLRGRVGTIVKVAPGGHWQVKWDRIKGPLWERGPVWFVIEARKVEG